MHTLVSSSPHNAWNQYYIIIIVLVLLLFFCLQLAHLSLRLDRNVPFVSGQSMMTIQFMVPATHRTPHYSSSYQVTTAHTRTSSTFPIWEIIIIYLRRESVHSRHCHRKLFRPSHDISTQMFHYLVIIPAPSICSTMSQVIAVCSSLDESKKRTMARLVHRRGRRDGICSSSTVPVVE